MSGTLHVSFGRNTDIKTAAERRSIAGIQAKHPILSDFQVFISKQSIRKPCGCMIGWRKPSEMQSTAFRPCSIEKTTLKFW